MKSARVIYENRKCIAIEKDGRIQIDGGPVVDEDAVDWLPPFEARTIAAVGLNYRDHAEELAFKPPEQPLIFLKTVGALIGHKCCTPRPLGVSMMHFECELAVVIGRKAKRVKRENAYDYVRGYTVANDYAVRDYLENYYRPNLRAKNRAASTPIGPWLVDRNDIANPQALNLTTSINGKCVQSGNTKDMIFDVPYLIAYLSDFMTLSAGDVILTGTPKGVVDCKVGDEVVTEIEQLGKLHNRIVAPDRDAARME
jgi:5-oxopent-3-ene-1,2,5-tricarboxylate decarboxylase/2-hydroxyhepta-2,4-diene-1,7-dioate isomerase